MIILLSTENSFLISFFHVLSCESKFLKFSTVVNDVFSFRFKTKMSTTFFISLHLDILLSRWYTILSMIEEKLTVVYSFTGGSVGGGFIHVFSKFQVEHCYQKKQEPSWNEYVTISQMKRVRGSEYVTTSARWDHLNIFVVMCKLFQVFTCSKSAT